MARDRKPLYRQLWIQVLAGMAVGVVLGHFSPSVGSAMKPLGDTFIKLIRMMITPIVFVTVVSGICKMSNMKEVGRIGVRALIYFEVATTVAFILGLLVAVTVQPGLGFNADPATLDAGAVAAFSGKPSSQMSTVEFLMDIVPGQVFDAFARGHILQVMLFSILFGIGLLKIGDKGARLVDFLEQVSSALFATLGAIMYLAPIGTFGAMAFTVGRYGIGTLVPLGKVVFLVYATCIVFILVGLGLVARLVGFRIIRFLAYIKEEILIALATSTSEVVMPRLMAKLEQAGCNRSVVGLVVPTGYSFNQDGSAIYQMLAVLFIAQAMNIQLGWGEILTLLTVLLITSKGQAGVSGSAFVTLAATLAAVQTVPVAGMALLLGVERFMSMARATSNMIGNGVATLAVARWDGALDVARMREVLGAGRAPALAPAAEPAAPVKVERT